MIYNIKLKTTDIQRFSICFGLTILPDLVTCGLSFCTGLDSVSRHGLDIVWAKCLGFRFGNRLW